MFVFCSSCRLFGFSGTEAAGRILKLIGKAIDKENKAIDKKDRPVDKMSKL